MGKRCVESVRGDAERVLHTAVAAVGVDFRDEGASLDLFGPFYGNGKKDI
ncbi:hypothetical protein [Gilvibacter sediminis]|nr:hypothetical protein [Gilvibacter sediminis]MDC7996642.1 hypothetical protein [Gilvibacter sediminis]